MNAADAYPERLANWEREVLDLNALGYDVTELDLRDYWDADSHKLPAVLSAADLIWAVGGNAFVLARAAERARLGHALTRAPGMIFAGYSAGACLTSRDLRGIELMDDPGELPTGYSADTPPTTLDLTGTRVLPHAGSPDAGRAERQLEQEHLSYLRLRDGDDALFGDW
ncbi:Type 1 glutamine amidotransferase-like domain-containing protein [Microbacterium chocolatum]|uniref:Type 1 glutamine amidotransferase-like domain-containing protein n=1 Tax=Microbacterium aurantiacum TaxID=162393 RepID=UPI00338D3E56